MNSTSTRRTSARRDRKGAEAVELAIVAPLALLLTIGLMALALGVFRQHQVVALAREAARWAALQSRQDASGNTSAARPATEAAVMANVIQPRATGFDASKLKCSLAWDDKCASLTVTVQYTWTPEAFFAPITQSSSSVALVPQ